MKSHLVLAIGFSLYFSQALIAEQISFGNNSSDYANDGECDDRRFTGVGMAKDLDVDDNYHDANDCRDAFRDGRIKLWDQNLARAATQCSSVRFGNNTSEWARDGECDDFRFEGAGMSAVIASKDIGKDAKDCKRMCQAGLVFLRDY